VNTKLLFSLGIWTKCKKLNEFSNCKLCWPIFQNLGTSICHIQQTIIYRKASIIEIPCYLWLSNHTNRLFMVWSILFSCACKDKCKNPRALTMATKEKTKRTQYWIMFWWQIWHHSCLPLCTDTTLSQFPSFLGSNTRPFRERFYCQLRYVFIGYNLHH